MIRRHLTVWTRPNLRKIRQMELLALIGPLSSLQPLVDTLSAFILPFQLRLCILVHRIANTSQCQSVRGVKHQIDTVYSFIDDIRRKVLDSEIGIMYIQRGMLRMAVIFREHLLTICFLES